MKLKKSFLLLTILMFSTWGCILETTVPISWEMKDYDDRIIGTWIDSKNSLVFNIERNSSGILRLTATMPSQTERTNKNDKIIVYKNDIVSSFLNTVKIENHFFFSAKIDDPKGIEKTKWYTFEYNLKNKNSCYFNPLNDNEIVTNKVGSKFDFNSSEEFQNHVSKLIKTHALKEIFMDTGFSGGIVNEYNSEEPFRKIKQNEIGKYFEYSLLNRGETVSKNEDNQDTGALLLLLLFGLLSDETHTQSNSSYQNEYNIERCNVCSGEGGSYETYGRWNTCYKCQGSGRIKVKN